MHVQKLLGLVFIYINKQTIKYNNNNDNSNNNIYI
jgi:hypothetical protein